MMIRRILGAFGLVLAVLALAWIVDAFKRNGGVDIVRTLPISTERLLLTIGGGAAAYATASFLLSLAWWRMLASLSPSRPLPWPTMATYAVSQYGRYLPGNVAHYVLRHAWGRRSGNPHESLALAAALEAALLMLVACGLTMAAETQGGSFLPMVDARGAMALLVVGVASLWLLLWWIGRRGGIGGLHIPRLSAGMLSTVLLLYSAFFVSCACLLWGLARGIGIDPGAFTHLLAANSASWLAGFIVIGAPAGIGIREAAFVTLAGTELDSSRALLLVGVYRLATFVGDTLSFACGTLYLRIDARRSREGSG